MTPYLASSRTRPSFTRRSSPDPRIDARATGSGLDDLRADAVLLQNPIEKLRAGQLAAGRIRRIDADVLPEQLDFRRDPRSLRNVELRLNFSLDAMVVPEQCSKRRAGDEREGDEDAPSHEAVGSACGLRIRMVASKAIATMAEIHIPASAISLRYSITTRCFPGVTTMP